MRTSLITILLSGLLLASGCNLMRHSSEMGEYRTMVSDPARDTDLARRYNSHAVLLLGEDNLTDAEQQLKQALAADVFFGPAHNNLGNVYYRQKRYYLAAWEFQYAAKLMPNQAEPKNNLAMVLEAAGKPDEAAAYYEAALKIQPENPEFIGNLARLYVKSKKDPQKTRELLHEIILKDTRPRWTTWAREQLALEHFNRDTKVEAAEPNETLSQKVQN